MPRGRAKHQGRRGWHREARHQLDERRAREAKPIPRSGPARLAESKRRLEQQLEAERSANEAYEDYRARARMRNGRRLGAPPKPYEVAETPTGKINTTDPDSRLMKGAGNAYLQAYNAQAATNERQLVEGSCASRPTSIEPKHSKPPALANSRRSRLGGEGESRGAVGARPRRASGDRR